MRGKSEEQKSQVQIERVCNHPYNQIISRGRMMNESQMRAEEDEGQGAPFNVQLTSRQMQFLTPMLPKGYSFQVESKHPKRASKSNRESYYDFPSEVQPIQSEGTISASGRVKKLPSTTMYNQQMEATYLAPKPMINKTFSADYIAEELKPCLKILTSLKANKNSWPFREPVDPVALGIPHYREIVQEPMDLQTVENHLRQNQYSTPTQFHADINKIIRNSYVFNKQNPQFTKITGDFEKFYLRLIGDPGRGHQKGPAVNKNNATGNLAASKAKGGSKKPAPAQARNSVEHRPPTLVEKRQLTQNIKRLSKEDIRGIILIVYDNPNDAQENLDIEQLEPAKFRELQKYVRSKLTFDSSINHQQEEKREHLGHHHNNNDSSFEPDSDS